MIIVHKLLKFLLFAFYCVVKNRLLLINPIYWHYIDTYNICPESNFSDIKISEEIHIIEYHNLKTSLVLLGRCIEVQRNV